jgi:putative transcriptional regulator
MPTVSVGKLLVSRPVLVDPNFRRTVVLVFQHDALHGTMGVVVNRPSSARLCDVVEKVDGVAGREDVLWVGGPCRPNAVWVLHRRGDVASPGEELLPGLFIGVSPDLLSELLKTTPRNPGGESFRVVRGYAGWAPGQLAAELKDGAWRVVEPDVDVLFGAASDALWDDVILRAQLPFSPRPAALRSLRLN